MSAGGFVNAPVTKSIIGLTTLATLGVRANPTPETLNHPPPKPQPLIPQVSFEPLNWTLHP